MIARFPAAAIGVGACYLTQAFWPAMVMLGLWYLVWLFWVAGVSEH
jgi:hypothetical protein